MDRDEDYFLSINKHFEEKLDLCLHAIEWKLDHLVRQDDTSISTVTESLPATTDAHKNSNPFSVQTFSHFKAPYVRDFRNFSGPMNDDARSIKRMDGSGDINQLAQTKSWSGESRKQLHEAVLDHYAQRQLAELIKQKNLILGQLSRCAEEHQADLKQKLRLIEEQSEQVRTRKEPRIFVPQQRDDPTVDWCAISAKLAGTHHDAVDCKLMWSNSLHWDINSNPWTKEEDLCLLNAVQKYGKNDWDSVATELNSHRLPWQCCSRFNEEFLSSSLSGSSPSSVDEIVQVINLCRIGNFVPWNQVMYFIQTHSLLQVKYIWHKLLTERRSNLPWSQAEDLLLVKSVERFGDKDWSRIASHVPGRSNKSCRERYTHRLKFAVRAVGKWTKKEDERLMSLVDRFGANWSLISTMLAERNSHQIRSRYELLNSNIPKTGPMKRRKIKRSNEGLLVDIRRLRKKPNSEAEVDQKLSEIFSTYQNFKVSEKSLVCRSAQDEILYLSLVKVIQNTLTGRKQDGNLLSHIIELALKEKVTFRYELFTPCASSVLGFKTWKTFVEHLDGSHMVGPVDALASTHEYQHILRIIMSLFMWPALLSRSQRPHIELQAGGSSIVEKNSKNLYAIRELQKQLISRGGET